MRLLVEGSWPTGGGARPHLSAAEVPLIANLPEASRERLIAASRTHRLAPHATLFRQGDLPTDQQIVLSGIVDLTRVDGNRECTTLMMSAGDIPTLAAALSNEPYIVSARALTGVKLLSIDAQTFRQEARRTPALAMNVAMMLAGQWRVAHRLVLDLKCRSPSQRLAAFLLRLHDSRMPGAAAAIPFSKRQLASRIGMQPETLSRTLQTLAANGLYLRGREIVVLDRDKIEAFCGPDPYPSGHEGELGVHAL
jgi:CRP/FNR family transcriptional activator FtrB